MNIVHIEDFFHPNAGYQINILSKYMVKQGHNVTIITSHMDKIPISLIGFFGKDKIEEKDNDYLEKTGVNIIRLPLISFISGRSIFTRQLYKIVNQLKPDILFIHGNDSFTAIRFLLRIKKLKYRIVMDSHMLEMASKNKVSKVYRVLYRKIITPIIKNYKIPVIRTQDDSYVEKCLGIPLTQCPWISVGSDMLLFHPDKITKKGFRKKYNICDNDFVIIYTGKLDESKGGLMLAQAFLEKFSTHKQVVIIIVGNTVGDYGKEVEAIFSKSENRIIRLPTQNYTQLPIFYQASDLSVFPKQCSLSFYDVQACGVPVVLEDNNINVNRLMCNNGYYYEASNIQDFRNKIMKCINMDENEYEKMKENAYNFVKEHYNYENITKEYVNILINEYKKDLK